MPAARGFWVARMAGALGAGVALSTVLGGESGRLLAVLLEDAGGVAVHAVPSASDNGVYVHDRRGGARMTVARVPAPRLRRHEADELYGVALADALDCGVACLTGPQHVDVLDPRLYERIAGDLRRNDVTVVADLTGPALTAALAGGVSLLKLSDTELVEGGWAVDDGVESLTGALLRLHERGADVAIASRGPEPAIALANGRLFQLRGPQLTPADPTGTGDAMFAAMAVSLARGDDTMDAIVLGIAAGAINATRHGLGTGTRREVEQLARHVVIEPLAADIEA